ERLQTQLELQEGSMPREKPILFATRSPAAKQSKLNEPLNATQLRLETDLLSSSIFRSLLDSNPSVKRLWQELATLAAGEVTNLSIPLQELERYLEENGFLYFHESDVHSRHLYILIGARVKLLQQHH